MTTQTDHGPTTDRLQEPPAPDELVDRAPAGRRGMPAGSVLVVMLVCLLVWSVLYAPELKRSSEAQPAGTRRTVSLAILDPVVWITDHVGITAVVDRASETLGRDPHAAVGGEVGGVPVEVDQIPSTSQSPGTEPPHEPKKDTRIREPLPQNRIRVAVVGDSLAAGIGYYAERVFKPFWVNVTKQGRISTGLARPDYFNWPAQMQLITDKYRPDLTIVMLGENDRQSLQAPGGGLDTQIGTPDWPVNYQARVERFARIATSAGGHVVWVGLPVVRDADANAFNQKLNGIFAAVADRLPNVAFFDTAAAFSTPNGSYTAYYRDGNKITLIRADDGIHFNADGYTILMEQVASFVNQQFGLDPKTYGG
jgi:hypothetical protein